MTGQQKNDRSVVRSWDEAAGSRLKVAIKSAGTQAEIAERAGISRASLLAILSGDQSPRFGTLRNLCDAAGILVDDILNTANSDGGVFHVPLIDVKASAGSGAINPELVETGETLGFPLRWLKQQFPVLDKLRLMSVDGASMAPTLQSGGWVMIDIGDTAPRDGVSVVRYDGHLYVKRLKVEPNLIRLVSDNDAWPEEIVDLTNEADREGFKIIGRAVWTGAKLTD